MTQTGVLPGRHEDLERVPSWLEHHLASESAGHASLVRPFLHLSVSRAGDGRIYRRKLTSLAFKGEHDPPGVPATWIVGEPAERAIQVLERLQADRDTYLFARIPGSGRPALARQRGQKHPADQQRPGRLHRLGQRLLPATRPARRHSARQRTAVAFCPPASFAGASPGLSPGNPAASSPDPWPTVITASRCSKATPLGTSASGFRAEVEAEDAIARGWQLCDLITSHGHHELTAPAAAEAQARFTDLERHVRFDGKVITDTRRLKRIMDRHDPLIYPGQYVTCIYNADRAPCRRTGDPGGPSLPDCQPLACRNVALTSGDIAALTLHRAHLEQALQDGGLIAPYVRHRLEEQLSELTTFLARHRQPQLEQA
jgi:hypothetical protein